MNLVQVPGQNGTNVVFQLFIVPKEKIGLQDFQ